MLAPLDDETQSDVVHDDSDGFGGFGDDYMVDQWSPACECDFSGDDMMVTASDMITHREATATWTETPEL